MRNLFFISICISVLFFSCGGVQNNTTTNGYKIERFVESNGKKPAPGDMAFVNLYFYMDGKMQTSTRAQDRILPVRVYSPEELKQMKESGKPNPVYDAISIMAVGDSLRVDVPITEEMREDARMADAKEMYYHVVMEDAKTEQEYKEEQQQDRERRAKLAEESKARIGEVSEKVNDILAKYRSGELKDKLKTEDSGLKYLILEKGDGPAMKVGQKAIVHYYGTLTNGEMFDNSFGRGQPYTFALGAGQVIKGWDQGIALLNKGDRAVLFIPSELGYGKAGSGSKIPGDSELVFYIEVM